MYWFDSDHLSILWYADDAAFVNLDARLNGLPEDQFSLSIVSFEEQRRRWLAYVKKATKPDRVVRGYFELHGLLDRFSKSHIIDFSAASAEAFVELRQKRIRISTLDLRIAAIAIANDLTLLTRNTVDFEQVPGLRFEDWTVLQ